MNKYKPDIVGMMFAQKEKAAKTIERASSVYGKCVFEYPLSEDDISIWESANNINIPEDYRAWLKYSGHTRFTGITLELYPPFAFRITENGVIIGHRENEPILFSPESGRYFSFTDGEQKNLGLMETIIRYWRCDTEKLFYEEDLAKLRPVIDSETEKLHLAEKAAETGGVKELLAYFFARNNVAHLKKWLCYPHTPLPNELKNCPLVISEANNEGYYQWQPAKQTSPVDIDEIEKKLGFSITPEIRELVTSYFFFRLEAVLDNGCSVDIHPILPHMDIKAHIIDLFDTDTYSCGYDFTNGHHIFRLGTYFANYDMTLVADNETGEVYAVDYIEKRYKKIADTLSELIGNMKPIWEQ